MYGYNQWHTPGWKCKYNDALFYVIRHTLTIFNQAYAGIHRVSWRKLPTRRAGKGLSAFMLTIKWSIYPFIQGLYSLSGKTSYRHISWSLGAARLDVAMVVSQRCRGTCQISERLEKFKPEFRGFETSRYLAVRRYVMVIAQTAMHSRIADISGKWYWTSPYLQTGTHYTDLLLNHHRNPVKIHAALIVNLMNQKVLNITHVSVAQLLWHVW